MICNAKEIYTFTEVLTSHILSYSYENFNNYLLWYFEASD